MDDTAIDTAVSLIQEIKSLKEYCEKVIVNEVTGIHIEIALKCLSKDHQQALMKLLPVELPLNSTIPIISDEEYWKRKCIIENWNYVHFWINNCSWKEVFICHYVEQKIDELLARKQPFEDMTNHLDMFVDHLKRVKINGYKGNVAKDDKDKNLSSDDSSFEDNIGKLFAFFPNIEEVYLNIAPVDYAIADENVGMEKGKTMIKDIFSLKNLTKLTIIGYSLKEYQILLLSQYLLDSKISYLNLACNLLNDDCCESLSNVLKSQLLLTLVLSNNRIGSLGITKILKCLQNNNTLVSLDVSKNYITDEGGIALAELLKTKFDLCKLDISFNKLGYESGVIFNDVVKLNSGLLCLNLTGNSLGTDVGKMFAESIILNKSLRYLGIEFCGFDEHEEDIIYSRIHKNTNGNDSGIFL